MGNLLIHRPLDDLKLAAIEHPLQGEADVSSTSPELDVTLAQLPPSRMLNLRFDPNDASLKKDVEKVLGTDLPTLANTRSLDGHVWWLGPDEWMVTAPERHEAAQLQEKLIQTCAPKHHSVVDVSHQFEGLRVAGPLARDLLAHIVTFDLHPRALKQGAVMQSVAAHCSIVFLVNENAESFDLYTRRSFIQYLWKRLVDAGAEMDLAIVHATE